MPEKNSPERLTERIIVGQFGRTFGVAGWIKVNSFTHPMTNLLDYPAWFFHKNEDWAPLPIDDVQLQGSSIIAHLVGYDSPEAVRIFTGVEIAVDRAVLPRLKKDEYLWCDLIGLTVLTSTGIELGKITRLFSSGASDIIVVQGEKEHLIPYIRGHYVLSVDMSMQQMIVDWDPTF